MHTKNRAVILSGAWRDLCAKRSRRTCGCIPHLWDECLTLDANFGLPLAASQPNNLLHPPGMLRLGLVSVEVDILLDLPAQGLGRARPAVRLG